MLPSVCPPTPPRTAPAPSCGGPPPPEGKCVPPQRQACPSSAAGGGQEGAGKGRSGFLRGFYGPRPRRNRLQVLLRRLPQRPPHAVTWSSVRPGVPAFRHACSWNVARRADTGVTPSSRGSLTRCSRNSPAPVLCRFGPGDIRAAVGIGIPPRRADAPLLLPQARGGAGDVGFRREILRAPVFCAPAGRRRGLLSPKKHNKRGKTPKRTPAQQRETRVLMAA